MSTINAVAHVQGARLNHALFAWERDLRSSEAEYAHREPGQCGRRPQAWRYHALRYRIVADPPPTEAGYRLAVEVAALDKPERIAA